MTADHDPWPGDEYRMIPDEYAHALGVLINYHNNAQSALELLLDVLLKNAEGVRNVINHHLNNSVRLDLLRELAKEQSSGEAEHILHAVKCFDVCTENRNILMHAMIREPMAPHEGYTARKKHSAKPGVEVSFDLPIETLGKAAENTAAAHSFIFFLWAYFGMAAHPPWAEEFERMSLPEKPDLPSKLNSLQRP